MKNNEIIDRFSNMQLYITVLLQSMIVSCVCLIFFGLSVWVFVVVILEHVISIYTLNFYTLFDNRVEVFYPTRFFNRRKTIYFRDVDRIVYCPMVRYSGPTIGFLCSPDKYNLSLSDSFACYGYNHRQEILKFLHSKGLKVEIRGGTDKDNAILE